MSPVISQLKKKKLIKGVQILDQSYVLDEMQIFPCAPELKRTH